MQIDIHFFSDYVNFIKRIMKLTQVYDYIKMVEIQLKQIQPEQIQIPLKGF